MNERTISVARCWMCWNIISEYFSESGKHDPVLDMYLTGFMIQKLGQWWTWISTFAGPFWSNGTNSFLFLADSSGCWWGSQRVGELQNLGGGSGTLHHQWLYRSDHRAAQCQPDRGPLLRPHHKGLRQRPCVPEEVNQLKTQWGLKRSVPLTL